MLCLTESLYRIRLTESATYFLLSIFWLFEATVYLNYEAFIFYILFFTLFFKLFNIVNKRLPHKIKKNLRTQKSSLSVKYLLIVTAVVTVETLPCMKLFICIASLKREI